MPRQAPSTKVDTAKQLLGSWRSDRLRTLEFWGFAKKAKPAAKRLFRARNFFGHLEWHVTAKRIRVVYEGQSRSEPYTVMWKDDYRVIVKIGGTKRVDVRDIHFDGDRHFYMLAGRANCEFFRRVRSNTSLERTREG
jgi:hypothetical protein